MSQHPSIIDNNHQYNAMFNWVVYTLLFLVIHTLCSILGATWRLQDRVIEGLVVHPYFELFVRCNPRIVHSVWGLLHKAQIWGLQGPDPRFVHNRHLVFSWMSLTLIADTSMQSKAIILPAIIDWLWEQSANRRVGLHKPSTIAYTVHMYLMSKSPTALVWVWHY